ncbi:hypothetical protein ACQH8C_24035, partial [Escherichia coli]|uniref:hypothetical protein n=1 Tax=Escherichia coli TaxID=562 RepID=UPI003CEADF29
SMDPDPGDEDDPITVNGYTYGDNNPVMKVDPDGHAPWLLINAAIGGYSAYQAYKSGKSRKEILLAGAVGFVGGGKGKLAAKVGKSFNTAYTRRKAVKLAWQPKIGGLSDEEEYFQPFDLYSFQQLYASKKIPDSYFVFADSMDLG